MDFCCIILQVNAPPVDYLEKKSKPPFSLEVPNFLSK